MSTMFKKRSAKSKASFRKRPATPPPAVADADSSEYSSTDDEGGHRVKRRRKNAGVVASSANAAKETSTGLEATEVAADRSSTIASSNDATKQSNWYDEAEAEKNGKDGVLSAKNLLGTTRQRPTTTATNATSDGTYKGASNYQSFIQKNPNAPSSSTSRQVGPVKAPTNIRTITVTDFAPDVCKDYKQTGFCGFGDSCKFLHAREDYKQGWELDRDWEVGTKGKKLKGQTFSSANKRFGASSSTNNGDAKQDEQEREEEEEAMLERIPFACIICKNPYRNPIVTRCAHYFCEHCAIKRYRRNPSCAACGAGTGGVFNGAKGLKKLLEKKRERARKRREEGGEDDIEEEDGEGEEGEEHGDWKGRGEGEKGGVEDDEGQGDEDD